MKIALVTHLVVIGDGQGRVNYELARHLHEHGAEVTLIAYEVAPDLVERGIRWLPIEPGVGTDLAVLPRVWHFQRRANQMLDRIGHEFDAIIGCGATLSRPHTLNAVHFVHGTWLRSPFHASKVRSGPNAWYQWLFSSVNARWELESFENAERIVAVSEMVRDELITIGVPKKKIDVVINGVDLEEFAPGPANREDLRLPEDVPLGLFAGDIRSPIKNLDAVLRAMANVPSIHLAVAGSLKGSPYPALALELGVDERVHFLGFRRDIADLMRAADFFALPSRRDSCPLVMLEAMASGLPIITSRMVGTANLVTPDVGFVLETPDDLATLENAMRSFAKDSVRCEAMGRAARETAEQYSWEKMSRRYVSLLERSVAVEPQVA